MKDFPYLFTQLAIVVGDWAKYENIKIEEGQWYEVSFKIKRDSDTEKLVVADPFFIKAEGGDE